MSTLLMVLWFVFTLAAVRDHASALADMNVPRGAVRFWRGSAIALTAPTWTGYLLLPDPLVPLTVAMMPLSMFMIGIVSVGTSFVTGHIVAAMWGRMFPLTMDEAKARPDPLADLGRLAIRGGLGVMLELFGIAEALWQLGRAKVAYAYATIRR